MLGNQIILKSLAPSQIGLSIEENPNAPQSIQVTGQVNDNEGQPLPGANVLVKGTSSGTTTDVQGMFSINVENEEAILVVSFIGFITQEVRVGSQTTLNISLESDAQSLSEVVVVGYGTQRKQDVTGSISSLKADDLKTQGANTIQKSLQGRAAGVQVESAGGEPGSGVKILIRGTGSLNSNNPLYIVDGVR